LFLLSNGCEKAPLGASNRKTSGSAGEGNPRNGLLLPRPSQPVETRREPVQIVWL